MISLHVAILIIILNVYFHNFCNGKTLKRKNTVTWGNVFDVPLESSNVALLCQLPTGKDICCEAVKNISEYQGSLISRGIGLTENHPNVLDSELFSDAACVIEKTYYSSRQETRDYEMSVQLQKIQDNSTRLEFLLDYITSPEVVSNSSKWLERVRFHMQHNRPNLQGRKEIYHPDDIEYLSYFQITKRCPGEMDEVWREWIEPLTITARHPHSFGKCKNTIAYYKSKRANGKTFSKAPVASRSNVDYVLLQSEYNLFRASKRPRKFYMMDSGTSTFDSSLYWFTCAYSQRRISFDQVFAWELTLLEPNDYWSRVPTKWLPSWHFYNIPISPNASDYNSPINLIKNVASAHDFVAFKLDIDTPEVELPIALSLLSDASITNMIDEFFFELHFRCEVMTAMINGGASGCGWGKKIPYTSFGLILDRPNVLQYFKSLREKGIRAHIWP